MPLFLVLIIDAMGFSLIFPIIGNLILESKNSLLPFATNLAVRELCYGLTIGSFFIASLFGSPFFGALSDRFGRKKIILWCLMGTAMAYLISYYGIVWHSISLFILGRFAAGFLAGSQSIAQAVIIDISDPKNKTANLAIITLAICLGWSIGPLLGGVFSSPEIMHNFSTTTPFLVAGGLTLLNYIWLWLFFNETHQSTGKVEPIVFSYAFQMLKKAFYYKTLRRWIIGLFIIELAFAAYYQLVSMYLIEHLHYSPLKLGMYNTYMGVLFCIALLVLIRFVVGSFKASSITYTALIFSGFSVIYNLWLGSEMSYWVMLIPITAFVGLGYACLMSLFSDAVNDDEQGWAMGVAESVCSIGWLMSSILVACVGLLSVSAILLIIGLSCSCVGTYFWMTPQRFMAESQGDLPT